ncbi:hypothetical protein N5I87_21770 [Ralstonia sp. CHL-2022]|uniref:Uncharacterized protein n=1 Tax=Ralstonia mojiangensis TaxID=2953895 RepID=A0AAE3I844_9RALS|nr:hypothetical protein [Ralstonia mojiangensis]MCT7318656.1 hypothetical protein [Ralstonia mojiangensis]MCT7327370.1 hypothetical protein [Ralstonia mojiangensis]
MSSPLDSSNAGGAEQAFREAFLRLAENRPERLPLGRAVSQNAVALEAGRDPSALKKSRYPGLVAEIQDWIRDQHKAPTGQGCNLVRPQSKNKRSQAQSSEDVKRQRDQLAAKLVEASTLIVELTEKISELEGELRKTQATRSRRKSSKRGRVALKDVWTPPVQTNDSRSG